MASYVNPFGGWAQGYGIGAQSEMGIQQGARQARAEDYDFNNMAPLRLHGAQLTDRYNTAALPYQVQGLNEALQTQTANRLKTQLGAFGDVAQLTGNVAPINGAVRSVDPFYTPPSDQYINESVAFPRTLQAANLGVMDQYRANQGAYYGARGQAAITNADTRARGGVPGASSFTDHSFGPVAAPAPMGAPVGATPQQAPDPAAAAQGQVVQQWLTQNRIPNFSALSPQMQGQIIFHMAQSTGIPLDQAHSILFQQSMQGMQGMQPNNGIYSNDQLNAADYYTPTDQ